MKFRLGTSRCALLATVLLAGAARAGTTSALFDFEDQAVSKSDLTTLSVTNAGITATIDRVGELFNIVDLSSKSGTAAFGTRSLSPTPPGMTFFNVNFSKPVNSFSAQFGDFGTAETDNLSITAFSGPNGTGTNLGTVSDTLTLLDSTTMAFKTLQISGAGIGSVQLIGGSPDAVNSAFYDNFAATIGAAGGPSTVPLPPALLTAPLGALAACFGARRLKGTTAGR